MLTSKSVLKRLAAEGIALTPSQLTQAAEAGFISRRKDGSFWIYSEADVAKLVTLLRGGNLNRIGWKTAKIMC